MTSRGAGAPLPLWNSHRGEHDTEGGVVETVCRRGQPLGPGRWGGWSPCLLPAQAQTPGELNAELWLPTVRLLPSPSPSPQHWGLSEDHGCGRCAHRWTYPTRSQVVQRAPAPLGSNEPERRLVQVTIGRYKDSLFSFVSWELSALSRLCSGGSIWRFCHSCKSPSDFSKQTIYKTNNVLLILIVSLSITSLKYWCCGPLRKNLLTSVFYPTLDSELFHFHRGTPLCHPFLVACTPLLLSLSPGNH